MSTFTKINKTFLKDKLNVIAKMEEEGTGKSCSCYFSFYFNCYIFLKIIGYCAFAEIWHVHCFNIEVSYSGISHKQEMKIRISFVLGKASFVDVPKIWEPGSNVEGKVSSNLCYVI